MTPKERAEQINREEREAERADLMRRALAYAAQKRAHERARALGVELSDEATSSTVAKSPWKGRQPYLHEWNGEKLTLAQLAHRYDVDLFLLRARVYRGIPLADALMGTMPGKAHRLYRIGGMFRTLPEWCELYGVEYQTVTRRLRHGIPLQIALRMPKGARLADYRHHASAQTANDNADAASTLDPRPSTDRRADRPPRPRQPPQGAGGAFRSRSVRGDRRGEHPARDNEYNFSKEGRSRMTVSVALAKRHMNIAGSEDDELIELYVCAAEAWLANYIGKPLADIDPLPADLKLALLKLVAFHYENREAAAAFGASMQIAPYGVTTIADAYRTRWFGEAHG